MSGLPPIERPLVPGFFLAGFADATGRLMGERRDRTRRRLVEVAVAVAELGGYVLGADPGDARGLARLLAEAEARAAEAVGRITAGVFPPGAADRASLALALAVQLVLGRSHRAEARRTAAAMGELIVSAIDAAEAAHEQGEATEPEGPAATQPPTAPRVPAPSGAGALEVRPPGSLRFRAPWRPSRRSPGSSPPAPGR
jgi:hypothetical protein